MFLVTLGLAAVCARVPGQERGVRLADQTLLQEKRIALVVGNTKYARGPLKNPANDARAMAARLEQLGFSVDLVLDANRTQFDHALTNFRHRLSQEAVGLFYFAGHGLQIEGGNYLLPLDFSGQDEVDLRHEAESADEIQSMMEQTPARLRILILDACRDSPFRSGVRSIHQGLAAMNPARGTFIAFSTSPGGVASDNGDGNNGLFTSALLAAMRQPGLSLTEMMDWVREKVDNASGHTQLPWSLSAVVGRFVLVPDTATESSVRPPSSSAESPPGERHLAVLPFQNVGSVTGERDLSNGLLETVSSMLTELETPGQALRVLPASEIRDQRVSSVQQARKLFGVNWVITGSIQQTAEEVWITANLVDAQSERQVRSRTLQYRGVELARLQENVLREIAALLQIESPRRRAAAHNTSDAEANVAFLQGTGFLYRYDIPGNLEAAIQRLENAVARDPQFTQAWVSLCVAYERKFLSTKDRTWLDRAKTAANTLSEAGEGVASAQVAIGMVSASSGDHEGAIRRFQAALKLDAANSDAYRELARSYEEMGRVADAEATYRRAVEIRPNDWLNLTNLATFCRDHQLYREAKSWFEQVSVLTPDSPLVYRNLGAVRAELGDYDNAVKDLYKSVSLFPTASAYSNLGTAYILLHRYPEAIPVLERAIWIAKNSYPKLYMLWFNLGDAYRWAPGTLSKAPQAYRRAIADLQTRLSGGGSDAPLHALMAACRAKIQEREGARTEIAKAIELSPADATVRYYAALVSELGGDRDEALAQIRVAVEHGYSFSRIQDDPEFRHLTEDVRYRELVQRFKRQ